MKSPLMTIEVLAHSPDFTESVGSEIGSRIETALVITLSGSIGAGKTQLAKGLVRGLGCPERATSPTFALCHYYHGRLPVMHVDTYRLNGSDDLRDLGLEEAIADGSVLIIEWPDVLQSVLPIVDISIELEPLTSEATGRRLKIMANTAAAARICAELHFA